MGNSKIEKIMQLDREIDNIALQGTSYYSFDKEQSLNEYDKKIIKYYQEILDLIIEVAKEENTQDIKVIDKKLENWVNTASMMIESYIDILQFYGQFNNDVRYKEITIINQICENLKLDNELEIKIKIELADCIFQVGDEKKARKILLDLIKNNPDEDEPYMCMQNWYMYYKPNINKLAEVIDLAEENKHILITDFGYDRLIKFYNDIGDIKNKQKYKELYEKWKRNTKTIKF